MNGFMKCLVYLAGISAFSFFLGRLLPKGWFKGDRFPFRPFAWEKQGALYEALGIRRWKEKVPDMSRIFPGLMPSKALPKDAGTAQLRRMIQETCVAEWIHGLLFLLGFGCVFLWKGVWSWLLAAVYGLLGNLPFMLIQRFNRPKLTRILEMRQRRERSA